MSKGNRKSRRAIAGIKPYQDPAERLKVIREHLARTLNGSKELAQIAWNEEHPKD